MIYLLFRCPALHWDHQSVTRAERNDLSEIGLWKRKRRQQQQKMEAFFSPQHLILTIVDSTHSCPDEWSSYYASDCPRKIGPRVNHFQNVNSCSLENILGKILSRLENINLTMLMYRSNALL